MVFRWLCFSPPVPLDQDTSRRANFSGATSRARRWRWSTIPTVGRRTHVFTYLASCFHVSTIPNLSGRLFSPKPTACLHSFWIIFAVGRKPNPAVQRTGASRFAQGQIQRQGRLAPVADLHVRRRRVTGEFMKTNIKQLLIIGASGLLLAGCCPTPQHAP